MAIDVKRRFQKVSVARQAAKLRTKFEDSDFEIKGGNFLVWEGWVQPHVDSRKYLICLNYKFTKIPKIWVVEPDHYKQSKRFTHTYSGNLLCLYYPKEWIWSATDYIADTMIPWACLWLYYHEIEEITGEWLGGGLHPGSEEQEDKPIRKFDRLKSRKKSKVRPTPVCVRIDDLRSKDAA